MDLTKELEDMRAMEEAKRLAGENKSYYLADDDADQIEQETHGAFKAPKVSVDLSVKKTDDYKRFKFKNENREVKRVHLERMIRNLKDNNRLEWEPILVNENMEIIDGQHRLKAAEKLGLPVYYKMVKGATTKDLISLQVAQMWNLEDYFHAWEAQGKEDYMKLGRFMKRHNLTLSRALCLFGEYKNKNFYEEFRKGNFVFNVMFEKLDENVKNIKVFIDFVNMKTAGSKRYLKSTNFWCALSMFLNTSEVEFDTFMQKLEYKLDLMRPATKIQEYMMIFKTIYNWKNKQPIE